MAKELIETRCGLSNGTIFTSSSSSVHQDLENDASWASTEDGQRAKIIVDFRQFRVFRLILRKDDHCNRVLFQKCLHTVVSRVFWRKSESSWFGLVDTPQTSRDHESG